MKKIIVIMACFILNNSISKAQNQEFAVGVGSSFYIGELNSTNTEGVGRVISEAFNFKDYMMSYSLGYRYNFKNNISIGLNFYHMNVSGADNKNVDPTSDVGIGVLRRNLSFYSQINQGYLDLKYEPFRTEAKWNSPTMLISPFIGLGVGFFKFNPKTMYNGVEYELQPLGTEGQGYAGYAAKYSLFEMSIPLSIGVKLTPKSRAFSVSIEANGNYTTTDYIDDLSTKYPDLAIYGTDNIARALSDRTNEVFPGQYNGTGGVRGGNPDNNDLFVTAQVKFHYYFKVKGGESYYKCCGF